MNFAFPVFASFRNYTNFAKRFCDAFLAVLIETGIDEEKESGDGTLKAALGFGNAKPFRFLLVIFMKKVVQGQLGRMRAGQCCMKD